MIMENFQESYETKRLVKCEKEESSVTLQKADMFNVICYNSY